MSLASKIFIVFFVSVVLLLSVTFYLVGARTEQYAMDIIFKELHDTQKQFQQDLSTRKKNLHLVANIITSDQKFRSFLSNIKDNYFPFVAELATATDSKYVFMVDDQLQVRAYYPVKPNNLAFINAHIPKFQFEEILDHPDHNTTILSLQDRLYLVHFIPLTESRSDNYAVAIIAVCTLIDNHWVTRMLNNKNNFFQAVFFNQNQVSASNVPKQLAQQLFNAKSTNDLIITLDGVRYICKRFLFKNSENGYLLSANLDTALLPFKQLQQQILMIGIGFMIIGGLVFYTLAQRITHPVRLLVRGTREIGLGNFDYVIDYQSKDEIGRLATGFNHMIAGLKEKELIRSALNHYIDPDIAKDLINHPEKLKLGGDRCTQIVLFSDIVGFTEFSETMTAQDLITLLNEYFTAMHQVVSTHHGIVDKFIGDALMAFWSPLFNQGNLPEQACHTAMAMQNTIADLRDDWQKRFAITLEIRIGIAMGEMIVGNIGSEKKWDYTCVGDTVNYSSRLESLNKHYGTKIIIDEQTANTITGFNYRELDIVQVMGRQQSEPIYELFSSADVNKQKVAQQYRRALRLYRKAKFRAAATLFAESSEDFPSRVMLERCLKLQHNPPEQWDGIFIMETK